MTTATRGEVTRLLGEWRGGDREAHDRLLPMVYRELRRLAARCMASERSGHTLQPTALVHEAYLRLAGGRHPSWRDRRHFFAVSARLMRRVLVDHARARAAAKRGGAALRVPIDGEPGVRAWLPDSDRLADLLALDQSLHRLSEIDPRKGRIIELRYFGGLTVDEVAEVLGVSAPTVALESRMARAWLAARNGPRSAGSIGSTGSTESGWSEGAGGEPPRGSAA